MSKLKNIDRTLPVKLLPVHIAKPWGQEIWYSGMEDRGESLVQIGGQTYNLSNYLRAAPDLTAGRDLLLLKVLDPKPTPVVGDLYFEVHEEKQEVYVVTHVDSTAWPNKQGAMRLGMNQTLRQSYASDPAFRTAYRHAVADYERIRRAIDDGEHGLATAESAARATMEHFTAMQSLALGDVVKVPTWTPHALQHGVRVVEFQTPTYERFIVSFAQKVLTQDHWDTDHAVAHMHLDAPAEVAFEDLAPGIQRITRFDEFNVWRCNGRQARRIQLPPHIPYAVVMALGPTQVGHLTLQAEEACFVPHAAIASTQIEAQQQLLLAAPDL